METILTIFTEHKQALERAQQHTNSDDVKSYYDGCIYTINYAIAVVKACKREFDNLD